MEFLIATDRVIPQIFGKQGRVRERGTFNYLCARPSMTRKQHIITILVLGSLSTVSPFSIDMYLPGFPAIANDLNTTIDQVQFSLTAYLVGIATGQLLYGPLLDRFGRRPPLYAGLVAYVIASLGCAQSASIDALIIMRFFQALGGCVGMVAAQALVRDLFPANRTAQAFSSITLVIAVSPMIAPTVGGYVAAAYGWEVIFIVLAVITAIILVSVHYFLPEGRKADKTLSLRPSSVARNFYTVVREPQFIMYALGGGVAMAAPFAYIAGSSFVFMKLFGATPKQYGWIFAIVAGGLIGVSQLNHLLLNRFSSQQLVKYTLRFQAVLGAVFVAGVALGWFNIMGFFAMTFLFLAGQGLTGPNSTALSLAPFTQLTGSAASLLGSFRMAVAGLVSAGVSAFHDETAMPMVVGMVACPAAALAILTFGKGVVRYRAYRKRLDEDASVLM
jgi:DHA1 family bicyclomycin/chloramphenicol resistance-like MFS transporter